MFDETIFGVGMKYAKRNACFNCVYKDARRLADFTIGDFWRIDQKASYYNEEGTSVIFSRTDKAVKTMDTLSDFFFEKVSAEAAQLGNFQQLKRGAGVPEERAAYLKVLRERGGFEAYKQFKPKQTISTKIKNHLPVKLYKLFRRLEGKLH